MSPFTILSGGKPALVLTATALQFMLQQGYKINPAAHDPMLLLLLLDTQ